MNIFRKKTKHKHLKALVVGLAVVLFWRGVWGLLDKFLYPDNALLSYTLSTVLGLFLLAVTHMWVKELE